MFLIRFLSFRMFSLENALRACARPYSYANTYDLWPNLFVNGGPFPSHIVEMRGQSKYAMNLVLMEMIRRVALPPTYDYRTSGRNASILYFSCQANFDHTTFRSYLHSVLSLYIYDSWYLHQLIGFAMNNLFIFDLENMNPTFMSNQDLDKHNIGLIVIDSMNGYQPEINLGIDPFDCLTKVQYLKPLLANVNAMTVYIDNNPIEFRPTPDVFNVINNVFIIDTYCGTGVQISSYENIFEDEILFVDPILLQV